MTALAGNQAMPAGNKSMGRLFAAYGEEIRCECLRFLRNAGLVLPVLIMPVALYLLFAVLISAEAIAKDPAVGVYLFSSFGILATSMPALFGVGTSLAMDREMGTLRLRRAQPAPEASWLVAKIVCGVGFGALALAPLMVAALATGQLGLDLGTLLGVGAALLVTAVPFCALGLMIGTLVKGSAAAGYGNLIFLPGCYLSGMFFPLPASMHWQVPIWPQFHASQLAMHAAGVQKFQYESLAVALSSMAGLTLLFSVVAVWRLARRG